MADVWSNIYVQRAPAERSWTQGLPREALELIEQFGEGPHARVIDVGGGASALAIALLERGYGDVTVVDLAGPALEELRRNVGSAGLDTSALTTFEGDILDFATETTFAIWHDRAAFHFLVDPAAQRAYRELMVRLVAPDGLAIIATFSPDGPDMCSGLPVARWSTAALAEFFAPDFHPITSFTADHVTPAGAKQSFSWLALGTSGNSVTR